MRSEFYMVLPSRSSRNIFPDNSATQFNVQLPQTFHLSGEWCVGLTEIQIPLTFQHVSVKNKENYVRVKLGGEDAELLESQMKPGVYSDMNSFLHELNNLDCIKNHFVFNVQSGGFVEISQKCTESCKNEYQHTLLLTKKLSKILGFEKGVTLFDDVEGGKITSYRPANLRNGLPTTLMVYTDICQPYVTGDSHSPLLRTIPLELSDYTYNGVEIKNFSAPVYVNLISNCFQTIRIYIRDEYGHPIPFDYGTLTVTLHFKCIG